MENQEKIRGQEIRSILFLMILFLPLSSIANYFNDRPQFTLLYSIASIFTVILFFNLKKINNNNKVAKYMLLILFTIFFSFLFLGNQNSFDIFWVLVLPLVTIMIESYKNTKKWLIGFIVLLLISLIISYTKLVNYDSFAIWSLLWAGIFVSYMSFHYKKSQNILENEIYDYQKNLEKKVDIATKEIQILNNDLEETQKEIIQRLGTLGEFRSNETGAHVIRVGLYSKKLALLYGLSEELSEQINLTAPLHDIGKVGIEDSILNKPAKLTQEEYETMKKHASIGELILSNSNKPLIQMACEIASGHHEKYDGSGYPKGLKGEFIPLSARIVAIADVFDALYSKRVYKKSWSKEDIKDYFMENKAVHFDPELVTLFLDNFDEFVNIYDKNK